MAEASLLHIAESLLVKFSPRVFKDVKSWWGAQDDLRKLLSSIEIIKAGLLDAEKRQEGRDHESKLVKAWLRRLKNVLFDAEDFFDEVFTNEKSKQTLTQRDKVVGELHHFFSNSNPVVLQVCIARKIKKIRRELDDIKSAMDHFKFSLHSFDETMCKTIYERETCSVPVDEIIGREEDLSKVMGFLLDSQSKEEDFPDVIPIVGFGGLGKTTLAQLLYNNEDVKASFELHAWACISETIYTKEKAKIILKALQTRRYISSCEIFQNAINVNALSLEELRIEIKEQIKDQKYLLVLDDFWDEDLQRWMELRVLLRGGKRGSKIVVTTRSLVVAEIMGTVFPYAINGLANDKAWDLFKRWAFRSVVGAENNDKLMEMGKVIVKKCKHVPLAIRAVASLLNTFHGDERMWKSIMESDLLMLEQKGNLKVLPVLKLSYDHLPSRLKNCFAFCSIFPKDYMMRKDLLVNYWIAQGYIEHSTDRGQLALQEMAENYLKELTWRSFLQSKNNISYNMHDLIHDLAQHVAGEEIFALDRDNWNNISSKIKKAGDDYKEARIQHLSFSGVRSVDDLLPLTRAKYLRSFIYFGRYNGNSSISNAILKKLALSFSLLRLLDLREMGLEWLPSLVGDLKHLRCLIICGNPFTHLPETITKLHNLKILDISYCPKLEALPANFKRLISLTCLKLEECHKLTSMPREIGKLSSLESLDWFIIGEDSTKCSKLEAISGLTNLRGSLDIEYKNRGGGMRKVDDEKRVNLSSSVVNLDSLGFWWSDGGRDREGLEFECSQLPLNLKRLWIDEFPGQKLPKWKCFNNLLEVRLFQCPECRGLPSFCQFPHIRELDLIDLDEMEYIQPDEDDFIPESHVPCLERLGLKDLPKLKAWSPGLEKLALQCISSDPPFPCFNSLNYLRIEYCPELMQMPLPPNPRCHLQITIVEELKEPLQTLMRGHKVQHHHHHHEDCTYCKRLRQPTEY